MKFTRLRLALATTFLGLGLLFYPTLLGPADVPIAPRSRSAGPAPVAVASQNGVGASDDEQGLCQARIDDVLRLPAHPGACVSADCRLELFMAVKAEPLLFLQTPEPELADPPALVAQRAWLEGTSRPLAVAAHILHERRAKPRELRAIFLKDGYLYADEVDLAETLVTALRADVLFREPEIWIQRGAFTWRARRNAQLRRYYYLDGPRAGLPVSLLLFDRVGTGPRPPPPVHRDVRELRDRLGFDRLRVVHLTPRRSVVELRYGVHWVTTLLDSSGARFVSLCELVPRGTEAAIATARNAAAQRRVVWRSLQTTITTQIDEELPFDEPRHEIGQEDGKLRPLWEGAYRQGKLAYYYHDDEYPVFGSGGQPFVPQVCVDFLLDTIERAGGTWWRPLGEPPGRTVGRFEFCPLGRVELRRVPEFVDHARAHGDAFEVLDVEERVALGDVARLRAYLRDHADDLEPGDMLFIGGYVPWEPRRIEHYHSFFLFESDPLTGLPLSLAGNAGRPSLRTWRTESRRAPKRTLRFRVRPSTAWLELSVNPTAPSERETPVFLTL